MINRLSRIAYHESLKVFLLFAICNMPFAISGCGYTTRSMISDKYRTIYVEPFTNKIDITKETDVASKYKLFRPLLQTDITKAVIDRYHFDGNLRPAQEENADLILKGEIIEYRKDPLRYDDNDEVTEYRLNLIVNISLYDGKDHTLVWQENGFTGYDDYFPTGAQATSEDSAFEAAKADLVRRIVERTIENW